MMRLWIALGAASCGQGKLYVLEPSAFRAELGEDLSWATATAPFVSLPGFPDVERVFYYRWRVVRKHIVPIEGGSVITEFLPRVPWAGAHNTIACAAGHHFMEGRWLRNRSYLDSYARFWLATPAGARGAPTPGQKDRVEAEVPSRCAEDQASRRCAAPLFC